MTIPIRIVTIIIFTLCPTIGRADNFDFASQACNAESMLSGPTLTYAILQAAVKSPVAKYDWEDRGKAPIGYTKGMALCFASVYQKLKDGDPAAKEMARARKSHDNDDALTHYDRRFSALGWDNSQAGVDTLRHLFVLMLGLGMRESDGKFCAGRDTSGSNGGSNTSEAGLFQMSWNAHVANNQIGKLFDTYSAFPTPEGYGKTFHEGVHCSKEMLFNWGSGTGRDFQALAKASPAFAVEAAAVGLRNIKSHWGPILRREAELNTDANFLYMRVQKLVDQPSEIAAME